MRVLFSGGLRQQYDYSFSQNQAVDVEISNAKPGFPKNVLIYFRILVSTKFSDYTFYANIPRPVVELDRFEVAWSPDNSMIATFVDTGLYYFRTNFLPPKFSVRSDNNENSDISNIRVWNISSSSVICIIPKPVLLHPSIWSPDGFRIVSGTTVYNSGDGSDMMKLSGSAFTSVIWSRDGTKLLSGHSEGVARLHDTRNGAVLMTFSGHTSSINSLAWSPDETTFATGSADWTARVWSIERNSSLLVCTGHKASVLQVWWQDDITIMAGASDNSQRAWILPPATLSS